MKLWEKNYEVNKIVEQFTVGKDRELDILLAPFDVIGSIAHITMLERINLLNADEKKALHAGLVNIYNEIENGNFVIEEGVEDVHSQVELLLTKKLGDSGKKIHTGRSRNDQVLLDLKLFIRNEIKKTVSLVQDVFTKLIELSEKHKDKLLPGYTHMQLAMPSSFGLWFGAYAESLVDDVVLLQAAYKISNKNPLGSAAGYGSTFPLNRTLTTELLGFDELNYNAVYAQMGRGKTERIVSTALASVASTLARFSMDVCMFMNQNFSFISLPKELTTGSSIMPHKKNPDVFELLRAKCNKLQALPTELAMICANLPSGYHRDMQQLKESFIPAFKELQSCLEMMEFMLNHIEVKDNILEDKKYLHLFSVEAVNTEVLKGLSFREAYKKVAEDIENNTFVANHEFEYTHEGSIGNLCNDKITEMMQEAVSGFGFEKMEMAMMKLLQVEKVFETTTH